MSIKIGERIASVGEGVGAILIAVLTILTSAGVVARYVFNAPLQWIDEATGFIVVAVVMFGAAGALNLDRHIGVDILSNIARGKLHRFLQCLAYMAVALFSGVFLYTSWETINFSIQFGDYSPGRLALPMWIPQTTLFIGAALLGVIAVLKVVRAYRDEERQ